MFQITKHLFFVTITTLLSAAAVAEETPETAHAPKAAMERIGDIEGDWISTVKILTETGDWETQAVNHVRISSHLNGLLLTEEELERLERNETSPKLKVDYTFDQYRNLYRLSAIDSGWGIMDIYEGGLEDGDLVVTNLRADTNFPLADGRAMHFRLRIPVTGETREMHVDVSTDAGSSWRPFFQISYKRMAAGRATH